jgi:HPt (histidine-containing phosphotransfer) domain-containing protein
MTLDALRAYGANTAEGMARCLNDGPFYLEMVAMTLADRNFDALKTAMGAGDARGAFAAAHSLKGSVGNVALTPIYEPLCALTELLRGADASVDGGDALLEQIMTAREKALSL